MITLQARLTSFVIILCGLTSHCGASVIRPNIILLLTDDQDVVLGGMEEMPNLQKLLVEQGTTFRNAFVHTPICCPSRSSILTGKYLHNLRVTNNSIEGNCYGNDWRASSEHETFATYARDVGGYQTSYAGKYLNQYGHLTSGDPTVPPGWDHWFGLVGTSRYYNYSIVESNKNSSDQSPKTTFHGDDYETDYLPDLLLNRTMKILEGFLSKKSKQQPFLHVLAWPAPHTPFTPAPQHKGSFASKQAPRTPNWNASCGNTKHWMVRQMAPIDEPAQEKIDDIYQRRLETLLSVDEHIRVIVEYLESEGALENAVIMYTSDNGFQLGQHRIVSDKRQLYEHDIRVPFVVRGPMFGTNTTTDEVILNIDIAPSIVELATGKRQDLDMDGRSFVPCRIGRRREFLVSYHGEGHSPCGWYRCPKPAVVHGGDSQNNTYHCVRTLSSVENTIYCEFDDDEHFVEYYDMNTDEWQLSNKGLNPCEKRRYRQSLVRLKSCQGESCRHPEQDDAATLCMS